MNTFSNMLRISGYSMQYRKHAIGGAISRMKEVRRLVEVGTWSSQYRDRKTILDTKEQKGGNTPGTWFLKGETTTTIVCTATPDSSLQTQIKKALESGEQADGGRTLVLEDGGLPITIGLKKRDPFRSHGCTFGDPDCMVDPSEDCSSQSKVYVITCGGCNQKVEEGPAPRTGPKPTEAGGEARPNYIGMTGTSLHARGKLHLTAVMLQNTSNALALHCKNAHNGDRQTFCMKSCTSHRTVLSRYKTEAVLIEHQVQGSSLNNRLEGGGGGRGGIIRLNLRIDRM